MRFACGVAPLAMVFHELVTHAVKYAIAVIADSVQMPAAGAGIKQGKRAD
jgi:hypothetical protein